MSTDKLTRCPHCKAAFKVSESQLAVASGRVRCGACMNVFDAIAYSLGDAKDAPENPPTDSELEQEIQDLAEHDDTSTELNSDLIQDNPTEDNESETTSQNSPFGDELSDSFKDLEETRSKDLNASYANELEEARQAPDDESWATDMLEQEARSIPESSPSESPKKKQERVEPAFTASYNEIAEPENVEFAPFSENNDEQEHISFYYDDAPSKPKRSKVASFTLITLNTLLVFTLVGLASWFHYEKLAKYPQVAALYQQFCDIAGCELPELSDITKIRSHNLVVRSHPTTRNALIIDAVITNEADYPQDFPDIALYFSDINNQTIAQRLIKPAQYLVPEILEWRQLPSNEGIHISLEIVDPGKEAVNYSLKFFPQKDNNSPDPATDQNSD